MCGVTCGRAGNSGTGSRLSRGESSASCGAKFNRMSQLQHGSLELSNSIRYFYVKQSWLLKLHSICCLYVKQPWLLNSHFSIHSHHLTIVWEFFYVPKPLPSLSLALLDIKTGREDDVSFDSQRGSLHFSLKIHIPNDPSHVLNAPKNFV